MKRKPIIIVSLLVYASGGVLAGLAAVGGQKLAYLLIMVGRIIQGIGAAGTAPLAMALVGDLYQGKARSKVLGFLEAANGLGKVISPILGSLIGLLAWWAVFFFPVLVSPLPFGLGLGIREPALKKAPSVAQYGQALKRFFNKRSFSSCRFFGRATVLFVLFGLLFYLSNAFRSQI